MRRLAPVRAIAALLALALLSVPALAQGIPSPLSYLYWYSSTQWLPVSQSNPLPVSGTFSASLGGFQPSSSGARGTPFTVNTTDSSESAPSGAVVVVSNAGATNPMFCNASGIAATAADEPISPNYGWFAFTMPSGVTVIHCIATGGSTTANMVGGSGLPTGTGGGSSGGGSGGDVNIAEILGAAPSATNPLWVSPATGATFPVSATFWPYTLGQQLAAASVPVVLTAVQISTLTPPAAITNYAEETGGNLASLVTASGAPGAVACSTDTASCSQNQQMQRLAQRLTSIVTALGSPFQAGGALGAGSAIIGKVGIDQTTPGTTNGVQVNAALPAGTNKIGTFDPATISTWGLGAAGAAAPTNTQQIGGSDGTDLRAWLMSGTGQGHVICDSGCGGSGGTSSNFSSAFPTVGTAAGQSNGTNMVPFLADGSGYTEVNVKTATGLAIGSTTSGQTGSMVMGAATTYAPTTTTADTWPLSLDAVGNARVVQQASGSKVTGTANVTGTSSTSLIGAVTSERIYVQAVSCSNSGATSSIISFQDGSGGTALWTAICPAGGGNNLSSGAPLFWTTAGNALYFASGSSSSTIYVSAAGYAGN
ncbi:MAG TPA: hypothetical protein VHY10_16380 [Xanthobacteraceae bacterium]|jgi:hypothetical protein|nr:hypothetical protein [Xanthobacteraceae bacterium]